MSKVLLVDDDEDLLFLIGEYLDAYGIKFDLAASAAQARKHLKYCEYDLVISDLNMPGDSGFDLFRSISSRYPGLPFIIMSGNQDPRSRREAMSMGICDYLEKPFLLRDLKRIITDAACVKHAAIGAPAA